MAPQWFYIFGYYGSKNAGDEAFRLAFQQLLPTSAELRFIRPSQLAENQALASEIEQDVTGGRARLIVGGGDQKIVLETGDSILVQSSAASSIDAVMSIMEIT
jgi:hypothetical protein